MADSSVAYTLENVFEINERLPVAPEATDPTDESETKKKNTIESFSQKFLSYFEPDLRKINEKLREVQQNQNVLIESLSQEKEKLAKCAAVNEVETAMVQINHYRMKLCRIKVNMIALKEQSNRLRKESLRIQQIKQKENLKKEDVRHKFLEEERSLEAKLSP